MGHCSESWYQSCRQASAELARSSVSLEKQGAVRADQDGSGPNCGKPARRSSSADSTTANVVGHLQPWACATELKLPGGSQGD